MAEAKYESVVVQRNVVLTMTEDEARYLLQWIDHRAHSIFGDGPVMAALRKLFSK